MLGLSRDRCQHAACRCGRRLLRQAIGKRSGQSGATDATSGAAFLGRSRFGDAGDAFEVAARQAVDDFAAWAEARQMLGVELDRPDAALDACRRAEIRKPSAELHFQKWAARCSSYGGRPMHGDAFLAAVKSGAPHFPALGALLTPLARQPDGAELLDFCDAAAQPCRHTALVRAHRAIAIEPPCWDTEALQIIDLDRYVARVAFAPPAEFGAIDQFYRQLADDILADRVPDKTAGEGFDFNPAPQFHRSEAFVCAARVHQLRNRRLSRRSPRLRLRRCPCVAAAGRRGSLPIKHGPARAGS